MEISRRGSYTVTTNTTVLDDTYQVTLTNNTNTTTINNNLLTLSTNFLTFSTSITTLSSTINTNTSTINGNVLTVSTNLLTFSTSITTLSSTINTNTTTINNNLLTLSTNFATVTSTLVTNTSAINVKVGAITDDEANNTLFGKLYALVSHIHSVQYCYPTLTSGSLIASGSSAWTLTTSFTELFSSSVVSSPFDIHHVHIGAYSPTSSTGITYQLQLYSGTSGGESLICQLRFTRSSGPTSPGSIIPVITPLMSANTRISAKMADSFGGGTCNYSVFYHTY